MGAIKSAGIGKGRFIANGDAIRQGKRD